MRRCRGHSKWRRVPVAHGTECKGLAAYGGTGSGTLRFVEIDVTNDVTMGFVRYLPMVAAPVARHAPCKTSMALIADLKLVLVICGKEPLASDIRHPTNFSLWETFTDVRLYGSVCESPSRS